MKTLLTGALVALTASAAIVAANPASAEPHGRYRHYGHDGAGTAVAAGVLGLALGAAIAGGHDGYYGRGNGYGPRAGYYYDGPPPGWYAGPSYYTYHERCSTEWRWDREWGRYIRVRACY